MYNPYGEVKTNIKKGRLRVPQHLETGVATFEIDDHPALSRNLLRDLQLERAKHYEGLIAAKDWPDFEKRRGLIHGIESAIALCEQAQDKLNA